MVENVPRVATSWHFKRLLCRLRGAGYGVRRGVVNFADFGVPQRRHRLVLIALRDTPESQVPWLHAGESVIRHLAQARTVRESFADLDDLLDDPLHLTTVLYPDDVLRRIRAVPKDGGSRADLPPDLVLECHKKLKAAGAGSSYGRMRWDDVAPTLTSAGPKCAGFVGLDGR